MKTLFFIFIGLFIFQFSNLGQSFDKYFTEGSLRVDYVHSATHNEELISLDELFHEPFWGGSKVNLIDKFNYGHYKFEVYDSSSNVMIYSRGYSTLSGEWRHIPEAKTNWRSFSESIIMPFPKAPIKIIFYNRKKNQTWNQLCIMHINPKDYMINPQLKTPIKAFKIHDSGEPSQKLDIVLLAEGYTQNEMQKFMKDAQRFKDTLLSWSPFKQHSASINFWAVPTVSQESGTDISGQGIYKNTYFDSHFYTFGTERYINTTKNIEIRNAAANAPYDQIYILVNTDKYGGAGIYNFYSICTADHPKSGFVFCHEFGHAFAGLADEYYSSDVAVQDYFDLNSEPWEMNITTLIDFDSKWKSMIAEGTIIPTKASTENKAVLGAYEGGGYIEKGIYRPMINCSMKSIRHDDFCPVCSKTLVELLNYYGE